MRIAFLVRGFVTEGKISGGTANYLHQTCLSLIKLGHQPVVFSATRKNSVVFQEGIETRRFQVKDWRLRLIFFITLHQFTRSLTCLYQSRKLNRETMKAHRKNPFDIIHCVNYMAAGLFRPKEIPTVVRISHHLKLWQETNGKTCIHPDRKITHWLEIRAAARADGIFAPSRTIADIIRKETGKPVAVIETPASAEISETDDRLYQNLLAGKDYLLFFGSLDRRKGVDVIAETLPKLLEKHPRLFFVFIGQDSGYQKRIMMSGYLRQKAGPHQKRVLCPGRVTREQLYPVLDNALAVILPSRLDNLPNACLEAMARRKVVVGTRGASFEQLIDDGVNGLLCEPGDPAGLLAAMERALALTPGEKEAIGERAFQRVGANNPEQVTAQLVDFYQKIIQK